MPTRPITIQISSIGTSAGPFTLSDDVIGVIDTNVPSSLLLAGYVAYPDVNATIITAQSTGTCNTTASFALPAVTPSPTPSVTPTPTPSPSVPTSVPSQAFFDPNYTSTSNIQGQGGRVWSRLTAPSGSSVELTISGEQAIFSVSGPVGCFSGILSDTTLPSGYPSTGSFIAGVSGSVGTASTPVYISDVTIYSFTMSAAGYRDMILVHRTNNLLSNFNNGVSKVQVTKFNGGNVVNGSYILTSYGYSDTGSCA